ncbi:MAG: hypothetical protein V4482_05820 [Pseudomonadota bacterium]
MNLLTRISKYLTLLISIANISPNVHSMEDKLIHSIKFASESMQTSQTSIHAPTKARMHAPNFKEVFSKLERLHLRLKRFSSSCKNHCLTPSSYSVKRKTELDAHLNSIQKSTHAFFAIYLEYGLMGKNASHYSTKFKEFMRNNSVYFTDFELAVDGLALNDTNFSRYTQVDSEFSSILMEYNHTLKIVRSILPPGVLK